MYLVEHNMSAESPELTQADIDELRRLEKLSDDEQFDLLNKETKKIQASRFENLIARLEQMDGENEDDVFDWDSIPDEDEDEEGLFGELPQLEEGVTKLKSSPGKCGNYSKRKNCKEDDQCVWDTRKSPKCQKRQRRKRRQKKKTSSPKRKTPSPKRKTPTPKRSPSPKRKTPSPRRSPSPKRRSPSPKRRSPKRRTPVKRKARSWGGPGTPKRRRSRKRSKSEKKRRSRRRKLKAEIHFLDKQIKKLQKKRAAKYLLYKNF